jgi:hypothetical protein
MKLKVQQSDAGSTIIAALSTILIVSLIGANVLMNCATRYNVSSKQVKAWKEALYAAESGGDIGFAEVRKLVSDPTNAFSGWTSPAPSPMPTPSPAGATGMPVSYYKSYAGANGFGATLPDGTKSLSTAITVDRFYTDPDGIHSYRIRATGNARVFGLPRVGMDNRMDKITKGDNLLRLIDFKYDHFKATYGDGDGNDKGLLTVTNPQIARRIEVIAVPLVAFTGALKAVGSFSGPGSAGKIDSYDSKNGAYTFVANNPSSPLYADSREGDVSVGTSTFSQGGTIYGNVTTNGANVTKSNSNITGTIDNNVPFTIPKLVKPSYPAGYTLGSSSTPTITPAVGIPTSANPNFYVYNGVNQLTINPYVAAGKTYETHVTVIVNGDLGDVTIAKGVVAKIYFTGDLSTKARDLVNNNVDGTWTGVYQSDGTTLTSRVSRASAMQLYGVSPTSGYNEIDIGPPGNVWATIYAPHHDMNMTGNPDWYGAIVVHDFSGNGNTGFHYDKQIEQIGGIASDYQLASYIEDVR